MRVYLNWILWMSSHYELRTPSVSEDVMCLMVVPMNKIDVGIKVLTSFGFTYRDTYIPSHSSSNLQRFTKENVVVRGKEDSVVILHLMKFHLPKLMIWLVG